jgi:hypothetical protein
MWWHDFGDFHQSRFKTRFWQCSDQTQPNPINWDQAWSIRIGPNREPDFGNAPNFGDDLLRSKNWHFPKNAENARFRFFVECPWCSAIVQPARWYASHKMSGLGRCKWQKLHSHAYTRAMVCSFVSCTHYLIYLRRQIAKKIRLWRCLFALFVSFSQLIIVIWIKTSVGITTVFHTGISRAVAAA